MLRQGGHCCALIAHFAQSLSCSAELIRILVDVVALLPESTLLGTSAGEPKKVTCLSSPRTQKLLQDVHIETQLCTQYSAVLDLLHADSV
jgi:hypothetical protein